MIRKLNICFIYQYRCNKKLIQGNYFNSSSSKNIRTNNQKIIKNININHLQINKNLALNGNYFVQFTHKIDFAIIINLFIIVIRI